MTSGQTIRRSRQALVFCHRKAKIQAIVKYWNSDEYKAIYGTSRLRIVTITTTEARMESLITWTRDEKGGSRFWFTTFDKVTTEDIAHDDIWRVANQEGLYRMTATKK